MDVPEFIQVDPSAASVDHAKLTDIITASSSMDANALRAELNSLGPWPESLVKAVQAIPIFLPRSRMSELQELCESLHIAVCDIIDRWWDDLDARFWERMPIDPKAEALLRWISKVKCEKGEYRKSSGLWRPDLLISENVENATKDVTNPNCHLGPFKICEINCRYPLSGYILATTIDNFHRQEIPGGSIFETTAPKNHGLGKVRFVRPEHLDVISDDQSPFGSKLIAKTSSSDFNQEKETHTPMKIDVIVIGARQAQLLALPEKILQELALRSLNDFRSIFLAHDKRMLAIIMSELENLASKQRGGLAETYIVGSKEMRTKVEELYASKSSKNNWLLKPIASGKGKGIVFGTDVPTEDAFHSLVKSNQETGACVLQQVVVQPRFPLISVEGDIPLVAKTPSNSSPSGPQRYLVGTVMMSDGEFLGTFWRASSHSICAFMQGAWFVGAVTEKAPQQA
ncbi:hypothetical protein GQ44DRAFT_744280 [Phaeosphaeriaceae sp. PMI808]|nr:hypothetical protein GQ44DRAFT_744280 [Phaeosphaeriaceae sp. PMI808]